MERRRIVPDCLFELKDVQDEATGMPTRTRYFLAVKRISEGTWRAIELNGPIRHSIIGGKPIGVSEVTFGINDTIRVLTGGT
ncbi:MAG: hypothetical protein Q7T01_05110 [bacterium]|nr:hypothetical protein [bacterium]